MDFGQVINDLERRLENCEYAIGTYEEPAGDLDKERPSEPLSKRVQKLAKETTELFQREKTLLKFEQKTTALNTWLKNEHASVSDIVLHTLAKRNFVLHNAPYLRKYASQLEELASLEPSMSPPTAVLDKERLEKLEVNQKILAGGVVSLHKGVSDLCDDYNRVITLMSQQLTMWDQRLKK